MPISAQKRSIGAQHWAGMGGLTGKLAVLWLILGIALGPLVQSLAHPIAVTDPTTRAHSHVALQPQILPQHGAQDLGAHQHGAAHPADQDHISAIILSPALQPAPWPQVQPHLRHPQAAAQAKAAALRRPPRTDA